MQTWSIKASRLAREFNYNSQISVPLIRHGVAIGAISTSRRSAEAFTDRQVELVQNFAAQAVIAIENARLLNELRPRTTDLTESLEQQTATSEVLKVISSSPGELKPIFDVMLANAVRICDAKFGTMFRYDNEAFDPVAEFGLPLPLADFHPTNADIPELDVLFVGGFDEEASPLGAKGLGELTAVSVAPAIANAVYHATGKRVRDLPITIEKLL